MNETDALAGIVKRLRTDKVGSVDPVRLHQNMRRAADVIDDLRSALTDANAATALFKEHLDALQAQLDEANARIVALTNNPTVKRSK